MQRDSDEDAWQAIVENYGERIELGDEPVAEPAAPPAASTEVWAVPAAAEPDEGLDDHLEVDEERFVPPPPPPLPRLPPDRLLAWTGLFGSPIFLLVCLVVGIHLPPWLGYLLVASFIGGFTYLVMQMPRDPADPWDDGARL